MARPLDNLDEIRNVAAALLRKASVDERLPTPVDDLVYAAGLLEDTGYVLSEEKIRQAPKQLRRLLRSAERKIRGALDRRERVIHVSPTVGLPAQRQFIRCHETMHDALPWQRDLLVLGDTNKTLAPSIDIRFEREANQGAAELLFQLDLLERIAKDYPTHISTPALLAEMFGASIHATIRRWTETHSGTLCVIALDPRPESTSPLTFRRYEVVESAGWIRRFGRHRFPQRLDAERFPFLLPLGLPVAEELDDETSLLDSDGSAATLAVQSFTNGYRIFVLLWEAAKQSFIARHRKPARIVRL